MRGLISLGPRRGESGEQVTCKTLDGVDAFSRTVFAEAFQLMRVLADHTIRDALYALVIKEDINRGLQVFGVARVSRPASWSWSSRFNSSASSHERVPALRRCWVPF